jgi:hypothetical protein
LPTPKDRKSQEYCAVCSIEIFIKRFQKNIFDTFARVNHRYAILFFVLNAVNDGQPYAYRTKCLTNKL